MNAICHNRKRNTNGYVTPHRWMHKLSRTGLKNCTATQQKIAWPTKLLRNCEHGKRLLSHTRSLIKRQRSHHSFKPPCRTRRNIICDASTVQTRTKTSCASARPHMETRRHAFRTLHVATHTSVLRQTSLQESNHLTKSENTLDKHKSY